MYYIFLKQDFVQKAYNDWSNISYQKMNELVVLVGINLWKYLTTELNAMSYWNENFNQYQA